MQAIIDFIRELYRTDQFVPLHAPVFAGNEKAYLNECVDSTFVSSVGRYVDIFETKLGDLTGAQAALAVVNGTQALYAALTAVGVESDHLVLTQSLTFAATCNAIVYTGAQCAFVDVDPDNLGMSPEALTRFLDQNTELKAGRVVHSASGRIISAVVPMHTFGHPCRIDEIASICAARGLVLVEDSAEALGTYYKGKHAGTFGRLGVFSFNGNKIVTTGGGGAIISDDAELLRKIRHKVTTAKIPHPYEFMHDEIGYNFRMPNINAALGCAQLETLGQFLESKRWIAGQYQRFFEGREEAFIKEPAGAASNHWLNAIRFSNEERRTRFLEFCVDKNVMTRAAWRPMHMLPMFASMPRDALAHTDEIYRTLVCIPSSPLLR